jgi:hypothetical protein
MKKFIVLFITLLVLMTVSLTGCSAIFHTSGTGQVVDKTYDFKDFTGVKISENYQYDIGQADNYSVVISARADVFERVDIRQSGNTLIVSMKFVPFTSSIARITITMPQLNTLGVANSCDGSATGFVSNNDLDISLSGSSELEADFTAGKTSMNISSSSNISGNLTAADTTINVFSSSRMNMALVTGKTNLTFSDSSRGSGSLTAADTQIRVNSSSTLDMTMKTGNAAVTASGSSNIQGSLEALDCTFNIFSSSRCELSGSAGTTTIIASGSGNMNSHDLILQNADVTLQSSSHAGIYTDGALNIDISGSSILDYYGNPSIGKVNVSSSSKLNHK